MSRLTNLVDIFIVV